MKVAVSASSPGLENPVDPRFGRCPYYLVVDTETMDYETVENPFLSAFGGAGIQAAQFVAENNVDAVLTGSCGPNAYQTLTAAGIKVIVGVSGTISDAVRRYASGALRAADGPDVPSHFGMGGGAGGRAGRGGRMARTWDAPAQNPDPQNPAPRTLSPQEELQDLKKRAQDLQRHMDRLSEKIGALEKQKK
ncbi:MAG: NifB/NifX family molybdenum-iron cluster-binding protein [Candidatus Aminicenantes bacterium]|nr:NifB/NifX family molybdenum-iron cluster-binding protein [Candidatus Aminicenantes bacterium]